MIDTLESRQLLAAAVSFVGHGIRIEGTSADDKVEFSLYRKHYAHLYIDNQFSQTINLRGLTNVSFSGGDGNDVLVMGNVPLRLYADGGDGNDAISASRNTTVDPKLLGDVLLGDSGNDYLFGGVGDDTIDGGGGDDGMFGDAGDDKINILSDSAGDDTVSGGTGNDTVDAADYNRGVHLRIGDRTPGVLQVDDFIFEDVETVLGTGYNDNIANVSGLPITVFLGKGNDIYTGGKANETIYGGAGNDSIATMGGADLIIDTQGTNHIDGGSGEDTLFASANAQGTSAGIEHTETDLNKLVVVNGITSIVNDA